MDPFRAALLFLLFGQIHATSLRKTTSGASALSESPGTCSKASPFVERATIGSDLGKSMMVAICFAWTPWMLPLCKQLTPWVCRNMTSFPWTCTRLSTSRSSSTTALFPTQHKFATSASSSQLVCLRNSRARLVGPWKRPLNSQTLRTCQIAACWWRWTLSVENGQHCWKPTSPCWRNFDSCSSSSMVSGRKSNMRNSSKWCRHWRAQASRWRTSTATTSLELTEMVDSCSPGLLRWPWMHPFPCWRNVMIPTMSCWTGQTRSEIQTLLACTPSPTCSSCQSRPSTTSTERRTERPIGYADSVLRVSEWIAILSR